MKKRALVCFGIFLLALGMQIGYAFSPVLTFTTSQKIAIILIQIFSIIFATHFYMQDCSKEKEEIIKKVTTVVLFILFITNLIYLLFFDRDYGRRQINAYYPLADYIQYNVNLMPFESITLYLVALRDGTLTWQMVSLNLIGNTVVFMPFAYFLPIFFKLQRRWYIFLVTLLLVVTSVEILQVVTRTGSGDIDDLILNVFGAMIAYIVMKIPFVKKCIFKGE